MTRLTPPVYARFRCACVAVLLVGVLGVTTGAALAQQVPEDRKVDRPDTLETRAGHLKAARAEKANDLDTYQRGLTQRLTAFIENQRYGLDLPVIGPTDLSIALGGLRSGAGYTAGLRYTPLSAPWDLTVDALLSHRWYYGLRGLLGYDAGHAIAFGYARYWHMPEEDYYGIGPNSEQDNRSDYRMDEFLSGLLAGVRPFDRTLVGVHGSYLRNEVGRGRDDKYPNVGQQFGQAQAPALSIDVHYAVVGGFAEWDLRKQVYDRRFGRRFAPTEERLQGLSLDARGGLYFAAEAATFQALGGKPHAFNRYTGEVQAFLPIRHGYHILAIRPYVSLSFPLGNDVIPFYMLQSLGGNRTLRGFDTFRFRDRHLLLVNAEYRWHIMRTLDFVLFMDAGQVAHDLGAFDWTPGAFERSYGLGARLKDSRSHEVLGRIEVAFSDEGTALILSTGSIL